MKIESLIYVAGHNGLVGSAIVRNLKQKGYNNIITRSSKELDLTDQAATALFFQNTKPEYVILAAAKVGGILANNTYRAQFIYENIQIQNNVIHQAYKNNVKKLLFLGSSCIYPKNAPQPLKENYLLTSELEYTNEPYAIAKIAGIKMCESYNIQYGTNFISVMPTNLYGPGDNYNLETSHVLPALIRKLHLSKALENNDWDTIRTDFEKRPQNGLDGNSSKTDLLSLLKNLGIEILEGEGNSKPLVALALWGSGKPRREFLHTEDMSEACVYLLENINFPDLTQGMKEIKNTHVNIGCGEDLSIGELAAMISDIVGFKGKILWDKSKPDGTFQKLMDVSFLKSLGWEYRIKLREGILDTYKHYLQ